MGLHHLAVEEAPEVRGQGARRGVARLGVFLQAFEDDGFEIAWKRRQKPAWRRSVVVAHLPQQLCQVRSAERRFAGQQLVESDAETVDVAPAVGPRGVAAQQLRRQVGGGARELAGGAGRAPLGDAEVRDPGLPIAIRGLFHQDVRGFDVAMDQPFAVGGLEPFGDLGDQADLLLQRGLVADGEQGRAVHPAHGDERRPFELARLVDFQYVVVAHARLRLGLVEEAAPRSRAGAVEELERHGALELAVESLVDRGHAALARPFLQRVALAAGERLRGIFEPLRHAQQLGGGHGEEALRQLGGEGQAAADLGEKDRPRQGHPPQVGLPLGGI